MDGSGPPPRTPSAPFNPALANAFFRAGEIETWGRGIRRIFDACKIAGTPKPRLSLDAPNLSLEFHFSAEYLRLIGAPAPETAPDSAKSRKKTPVSTPLSLDKTGGMSVLPRPPFMSPPASDQPLHSLAERTLKRALKAEEAQLLEAIERVAEWPADERKMDKAIARLEKALVKNNCDRSEAQSLTRACARRRKGDAPMLFALICRTILLEKLHHLPFWTHELETSPEIRELKNRLSDESKIETWRGQMLVRRATVSNFLDTPVASPGAAPGQLRLRQIDPGLFRWEIRSAPDTEWARIPSSTLSELRSPGMTPVVAARLMPFLAPESLPVLSLIIRYARGTFGYGDITAAATRHTTENPLLDLLRDPALAHTVVNKSGTPMTRSPQRLVWSFRRMMSRPGYVFPFLADAHGHDAPRPLVAIAPGLYASPDAFHAGPAPLGDYDGSEETPEFLEKTFESPSFIEGLRAHGDIPPENASDLPPPLRLSPRLEAEFIAGDATTPDRALFRLLAHDDSGTPRLEYQPHGWIRLSVPEGALTGAIDEESLRAHRDHFRHCPGDLTLAGMSCDLSEISLPGLSDWLRFYPDSLPVKMPSELASLRNGIERAEIRAQLDAVPGSNDWFDLRLIAHIEDVTLTPEEIERIVAARGAWTRIAGKGWRRALAANDPATAGRLERLGLSAEALDGSTQRFHAAQLAGDRLENLVSPEVMTDLRLRADRLAATPKPELPAGLRAELRPYQHDGFHFLAHLSANGLGGILADDMGLGKTLQTLAWIAHLNELRPADAAPFRVLVVAPKSVVHNWISETAKFTPGLCAVLHDGDHSATKRAAAHLVVVNYARLRSDSETFLAELWDAVVLDEGQHIKNHTAAVAKVAHGLQARHRMVLTGTPVENGLGDLWSLMRFALPGLLGSAASFRRHYDAKRDPRAATRLGERLRPFLLRRTKKVVAKDLPERTEEDYIIGMEPAQRRLYDDELKLTRSLLLGATSAKAFNEARFNILQSLLRLRQIACDPRLVFPDTPEAESSKLEALLELLRPMLAEGRKVLVFSQFTTALDLISDRLRREKIAHLMLTGKTENRAELVTRFQKPDTEQVFLLSLRAAGSGLTLTAASAVVLFDPWWNPAAESQAIDRTHRIGQTNPVVAYRFLAKDSIEEKIRALQREKADLADRILEESDPASLFDLDTLRSILAG